MAIVVYWHCHCGCYCALATTTLRCFVRCPQSNQDPCPGNGICWLLGVLSNFRGMRTYGYVLCNGIYHSGVYTWLGFYLSQRYEMDTFSIGLNILGYGIPGLIFSPLIGKAVDRWGRRWLIPPGLAMAAIAGLTMVPFIPPSPLPWQFWSCPWATT
ncbi:MFS transporter [Synechocystis sp. B12]|nr:MFS transporter [Synechocystis sp. B12]